MIPVDIQLAKAIGARILELRLQCGLTQLELAERIGSQRPVVTRMERGLHVPAVQTLARVAQAFGIGLAELFQGVDSTPRHNIMRSVLKETA